MQNLVPGVGEKEVQKTVDGIKILDFLHVLLALKKTSSYTHGKGKRHAQKLTSYQRTCKPVSFYLFQLQRRW